MVVITISWTQKSVPRLSVTSFCVSDWSFNKVNEKITKNFKFKKQKCKIPNVIFFLLHLCFYYILEVKNK